MFGSHAAPIQMCLPPTPSCEESRGGAGASADAEAPRNRCRAHRRLPLSESQSTTTSYSLGFALQHNLSNQKQQPGGFSLIFSIFLRCFFIAF